MAIPLSKAKELCTSSEYALVTASRTPRVNKLSPEQSRGLAGRARKALDKWQDLSRAQARTGSPGERTRLKVELFKDVLGRFEDKAASRTAAGASAGGVKRGGASKRTKAEGHRKARATAREELAGATTAWDAKAKEGGAGAVRKKAAKTVKDRPGAQAATPKKHRPPLKWADILSGAKFPGSPDKQPAARARAKQFRVAESGMASRVRGHITAAGKRSQARRDRKGSQAAW